MQGERICIRKAAIHRFPYLIAFDNIVVRSASSPLRTRSVGLFIGARA
jgi:hypothetical protein